MGQQESTERQRWAYLGPEGTFTEQASRALAERLTGPIDLAPAGSVSLALDEVRTGRADAATAAGTASKGSSGVSGAGGSFCGLWRKPERMRIRRSAGSGASSGSPDSSSGSFRERSIFQALSF